ncbi:hypothetical protein [Dyadobacter sp. CY343]|nr:hypothetical protein [Dyadobacter sp. CY343]MCE7062150.1 hypothetical protein [Dyadobacter sp. CY343]
MSSVSAILPPKQDCQAPLQAGKSRVIVFHRIHTGDSLADGFPRFDRSV